MVLYPEMRVGERGAGHDKPRPAVRIRSNPGVADEVAGTITVQGEVTGNYKVNRALARDRTKNSEKAALRGPMETYGGNIDQLQIKQHDLVWAQKNPERTTQAGKKTPAKTGVNYAMASMTGIATKTRDVHTQEDWEDLFYVPGRAKADWSFRDPSNGAGVAVQMRGSCTVRNNGEDTFYPGDYVAWKSWNIDPDIRQVELHKVRRNNGEPQGKLGVLLRRVCFDDIHRLPHSALTRYFKRRKDAGHSAFLRADYHQMLGDMTLESKDRFFLHNMRAESSLGLLLNMATGMQSGLISINLTGNPNQDRALLADIEKKSAEDLMNNFYRVDAASGRLITESDAGRKETWNKFVMLAKALGVLGVTSEPGSGGVPHLHRLIEANILRANRGLMNQPDTYSNQGDYAISRMGPKTDELMAFQPMSKNQSVETKLDMMQRDYAVKKYATYAEAEHHARKNIIGICYKASEAGSKMDLLM